MGKVIPSFSVRSLAAVVLTIPIYLIILSYKRFLSTGIHREDAQTVRINR
jgi:hypothetical protein